MISNQVQVDPWSWIIVYNFNCTTHITISYLLLLSYHHARIFIAYMLKWNLRDSTGTQCPYIAIYILIADIREDVQALRFENSW